MRNRFMGSMGYSDDSSYLSGCCWNSIEGSVVLVRCTDIHIII